MGQEKTKRTILKVLELSAADRQPEERTLQQGDPVTKFFDWLLEADLFDCAVLASRKGMLQRPDWPRVVLTAHEAKSGRPLLERAARSGFGLVICTRSGRSDLAEFFGRLGYRVEGSGIFGGGDEHDPVRPAWNREVLEQMVAVASRLCEHPLCVFGHDGDPVYLLYSDDSQHESG
jgi:hypothetical protein